MFCQGLLLFLDVFQEVLSVYSGSIMFSQGVHPNILVWGLYTVAPVSTSYGRVQDNPDFKNS